MPLFSFSILFPCLEITTVYDLKLTSFLYFPMYFHNYMFLYVMFLCDLFLFFETTFKYILIWTFINVKWHISYAVNNITENSRYWNHIVEFFYQEELSTHSHARFMCGKIKVDWNMFFESEAYLRPWQIVNHKKVKVKIYDISVEGSSMKSTGINIMSLKDNKPKLSSLDAEVSVEHTHVCR